MTTLVASPYSYILDDLVVVRISATNSIGTSTASAINTSGALVRTTPSSMSTPTVTSKSTTSITIQWTALTGTSTGNTDITKYELVWDNGSGTLST